MAWGNAVLGLGGPPLRTPSRKCACYVRFQKLSRHRSFRKTDTGRPLQRGTPEPRARPPFAPAPTLHSRLQLHLQAEQLHAPPKKGSAPPGLFQCPVNFSLSRYRHSWTCVCLEVRAGFVGDAQGWEVALRGSSPGGDAVRMLSGRTGGHGDGTPNDGCWVLYSFSQSPN